TDKDVLFKGLSAVIAYLCELDGVENVMGYSKLFEESMATSPSQELIA
ncbi:MAG: Na(+)-translocating NADH-quinone reductase subunit F, partial [Flavobacteriaceae bacterium]